MRHQYQCPGRAFEEQQAADWQCQPALQTVEASEPSAAAKAMLAYQNAMFAAAYCRKDNGRCEGCGQ